MVQALILNRAPIGPNFEDYSVLEEGVGRHTCPIEGVGVETGHRHDPCRKNSPASDMLAAFNALETLTCAFFWPPSRC
jgi:hypothetical protein